MISRTRVSLDSIKALTQRSKGRLGDEASRELFFQTVHETIEKTEVFMNSLVDYLKVSTPLVKRDTVTTVIEEVLKKHRTALEQKRVKVHKQFEKDLPETALPEIQLAYILDSVIQDILDTIAPDESLGIVAQASGRPDQGSEPPFRKDGVWIEILVLFFRPKKLLEQPWMHLGVPIGEGMNFTLGLVKEMIRRNRGTMTVETDERKRRTLLSFRLPVERRKVVRYPDGQGGAG